MQKETKKDKLTVKIFDTRTERGEAAAQEATATIQQLLKEQETLSIIFAAAPSQSDFIASLLEADIDWTRINAFHMDEYIGLSDDAPQGFGNFLKERIFDRVPFRSINFLKGSGDAEAETRRYEELLEGSPADIVFMGIGENTHIAFNDPHVARFDDQSMVKIVDLDQACRQQQVNDGCFADISQVPTHALTLTVPALVKAKYIFCMVPSKNKAEAVRATLTEDISERYPSTILRRQENATLYIDRDSASLLDL